MQIKHLPPTWLQRYRRSTQKEQDLYKKAQKRAEDRLLAATVRARERNAKAAARMREKRRHLSEFERMPKNGIELYKN